MTTPVLPRKAHPAPAPPTAVPLPVRVVTALVAGALAYGLVWSPLHANAHFVAKDYTWPWRAARVLLQGHDPYQVIQSTGPFPFSSPFFYPLPAALVSVPFAPLPPERAGALFFGVSTALLAFGVTRDGLWRLLVFTAAPFFMAAANTQWSPLLAAGALLPGLQWVAAAKPTIGLAAFSYRPSRWGIIGGAILVAISFAVLPDWVAGWRAAIAQTPHHAPPALRLRLGGFLLLLALCRWRTPEGRLLTTIACVPQVLYFYDQFLLWLAPRTWRQMLALSACSWLGVIGWWIFRPPTGSGVPAAAPFVMGFVYLPALVLVMRFRNEGTLPEAVARLASAIRRVARPRRTPASACRSGSAAPSWPSRPPQANGAVPACDARGRAATFFTTRRCCGPTA
ncbi:MAG: hypothetical protein ACJ79S_02660 [Gemmatimonadaceae bacterium]